MTRGPVEELAALSRELLARAESSTREEWSVDASPVGEASKTAALTSLSPSPSVVPSVSSPVSEGFSSLESVAQAVLACRACRLSGPRIKAVPGVGKAGARVMLIGEGPGFDEDHQGEPFVGKAGELLDKILESIGLSREAVYITNVVKCHPMADPSDPEKRGNDRAPEPDEMDACRPFLDEQIRLVAPRVIVALGATAAKALCGTQRGITAIRGDWHEYRGVPVLPTFHPAHLLRKPEFKRDVWTDMKSLKRMLEEQS